LRITDILDGSRRQGFLIALDGPDLAVTLDGALPAQREGAHHALLRAAGHPPGEQLHIGLFRAQDDDLDPHPLQPGNGGIVDEVPMLRYLAGDALVEHHFAVDRLIQRLPMLFCKQNGGQRIFPE